MKEVTYKGWVYADPANSWNEGDANCIDGFLYRVSGFNSDASCGTAIVTMQIDEDYDPRADAIAQLKEQQTKLRAEFQMKMTEIEAQINKYTALEMK